MSDVITCRACGTRHSKRYMCDPVFEVTQRIFKAAEDLDIPVQEFMSGPHDKKQDFLGEGTVTLRQLKIFAAVVPVRDSNSIQPFAKFPAIVLTGLDITDKELPQWVFPGSPTELRGIRDVFDRMVEMAIRRAGE